MGETCLLFQSAFLLTHIVMEMIVWGGGCFVLLLCILLLFLAVQRGLQDLSSLTRDEIGPWQQKAPRPNHWTTQEFPEMIVLQIQTLKVIIRHKTKKQTKISLYTESQPESDKPCFKSCLYHLLVDWVLDKLLNFWSLSFLIFKNRVMDTDFIPLTCRCSTQTGEVHLAQDFTSSVLCRCFLSLLP